MDFDRRRLSPTVNLRTLRRLHAIYRRIRPDLVHHVTLQPTVLGSTELPSRTIPASRKALAMPRWRGFRRRVRPNCGRGRSCRFCPIPKSGRSRGVLRICRPADSKPLRNGMDFGIYHRNRSTEIRVLTCKQLIPSARKGRLGRCAGRSTFSSIGRSSGFRPPRPAHGN